MPGGGQEKINDVAYINISIKSVMVMFVCQL